MQMVYTTDIWSITAGSSCVVTIWTTVLAYTTSVTTVLAL